MAATGETISVQCGCGKKLKAPATAIGRKAKCPACGNVLTIEPPPPPPPVHDAPPEDDPLGGLYALAEAEKTAANTNQIDDSPRCPKCGADLAVGAVFCVNCGFDARKGKAVTTQKLAPLAEAAPAKGGKAKKEKAERVPGDGNWFMGVIFGGLFALGGAVVYGALSYFLDDVPFVGMVVRWSILLVGYLAGMGVDKGYKGGNFVAGITAAGITLCTYLFTNFVVLALIIAPHVKEALDEMENERDPMVIEVLVDEQMAKAKMNSDNITPEQRDAFDKVAHQKFKTMSDSEYKGYEKKLEVMEQRDELAEYIADDVLKEQKIDPDNASIDQHMAAAKEARKRARALPESEIASRLKKYESAEEHEEKVAAAKEKAAEKSSGGKSGKSAKSDEDSGPSGSIIGFAIILGIILFVWLCLPAIVAMLLAYKVAANA